MPFPDDSGGPGNLALINYCHARYGYLEQGPFNIPGQTFTRLPLVAETDPDGLWDDTGHVYVVPQDGTYMVVGVWRPLDDVSFNAEMGVGIDTAEQDSLTFRWGTNVKNTIGSGITRSSHQAVVILPMSAGDEFGLIGYVDIAGVTGLNSADFQIYMIAATTA